MWKDVAYQPGEIKAVAYKEGKLIGESVLKTAGIPSQIKLIADRKTIKHGGDDLSYILIEACDKNGNPCPLADNLISFNVSGQGFIAGVGNGNPRSYEPFQSNQIKLFNGKAMLIIGSGNSKGKIDIVSNSKTIDKASISIIIE
jgi:beta-galactosidase